MFHFNRELVRSCNDSLESKVPIVTGGRIDISCLSLKMDERSTY